MMMHCFETSANKPAFRLETCKVREGGGLEIVFTLQSPPGSSSASTYLLRVDATLFNENGLELDAIYLENLSFELGLRRRKLSQLEKCFGLFVGDLSSGAWRVQAQREVRNGFRRLVRAVKQVEGRNSGGKAYREIGRSGPSAPVIETEDD